MDKATLLGVVATLLGIVVSLAAWLFPGGAWPSTRPPSSTGGAAGATPGAVVQLAELPRVNTDNPLVTVGSASIGGRAYPRSVILQIVNSIAVGAVGFATTSGGEAGWPRGS